jgi:hypothetical protein
MRALILLRVVARATTAQLPVRLIAAPEVKSPTLGSPTALRVLPDGRVLVNDTQRRQVLLFDPTLRASTVVIDSTSGTPNAYGARSGGLIPFLADSTLFVDPDGLSMFVLSPDGKIARVASVPRAQDAAALAASNAASDATGKLVYRGIARVKQVTNGGLTTAEFPDSVSIDRIDLATRRVDTLGYFRVTKTNMIITQTERGVTIGAELNPVQTVDDWAVLTDGTLAIVRGLDYRVDLVRPNGERVSAPKIPFSWRPLTDEEKLVVIDSAKRGVERMLANGGAAAAMALHGGPPPGAAGHGGGASFGNNGNDKNPPVKIVPASALPDYWPAFDQNAVKADRDGFLWVRTSAVRPGASGPIYDVIDRDGKLVDRVQLPPGRRVIGFAPNGVVFLSARDDTGSWIERTHR